MANSGFHLVTYNNGTIKVRILSRYTLVAMDIIKVLLPEVGFSTIW